MKTKFSLSILALALVFGAFGQKPSIELTFTAIDSAAYVQLNSIKVMNRTQGGDTTLYWPDTVLVLDYQVGITEFNNAGENLQVFQNYPNPVIDQTTITLFVPEKDKVGVMISDMLGRKVINTEMVLERGHHSFRFTPGSGSLFFFTAQWRGHSSCIKILQATSNAYGINALEYIGSEASSPQLKATEDIQSFLFSLGDELLYIGYTDTLQSGMLDVPEVSKTYTFQFATNIPCPGTPTVTYEGQVYNTIQIFSQCWLKENLNVGTMLSGSQSMTNNGVIEKYCYNHEPDSCTKYGGLYNRDEMMQYTMQQGVQGICPPGWHLPANEEWKVLEGAVDSQYGIGDQTWDNMGGWRGYDAGTNLKTTSGWNYGGNGTDLFDFSGLPGGLYLSSGWTGFYDVGDEGYWMLPSCYSSWTLRRILDYDHPEIYANSMPLYMGHCYSVRCLKDD